MANILLKNKNIPIKTKYKELGLHITNILEFPPFKAWQVQMEKSPNNINISEILIQDIDFFGPRIGFLKFKVEARYEDGTLLPGIVFSRGPSVAVFLVLNTGEVDPWVVLVKQPRLAIGSFGFLELPAGMLDDSSSLVGVAAKELEEECGIVIKEQDLVPLSTLYPSPGGCDEYLKFFSAELKMTVEEALKLNGKLGGLQDHGERIHIELMRKSNLYSTNSMPILAALALYDHKSKSKVN
jgi:ADP-sugar diphosphatase